MQTIEDQTFENVVVALDGKIFLRCRFINCTIVYGGGDCFLSECEVGVNTHRVIGAAQRTIDYMRFFGLTPETFGELPK